MLGDWGSVEGDQNAKSIMADRASERATLTVTVAVFFLILIFVAIWYAGSGSRIALAIEIVVAAICAAGWARMKQFETHTFVMIVEQRARNIEVASVQLLDRLGLQQDRT